MQKIGHHVQVEVKSLRRYEDFAADVKDRPVVCRVQG